MQNLEHLRLKSIVGTQVFQFIIGISSILITFSTFNRHIKGLKALFLFLLHSGIGWIMCGPFYAESRAPGKSICLRVYSTIEDLNYAKLCSSIDKGYTVKINDKQ